MELSRLEFFGTLADREETETSRRTPMETFSPNDAEAYKALARGWAATVTVVTARRRSSSIAPEKPEIDGFTATAFLTISIDPPIIAVSVGRSSGADLLLKESEAFAVNFLRADQADVSAAFARPSRDRGDLLDRFGWKPDAAGVPLLEGTAGAFSAKVRQVVEAGDHLVVLGDVLGIHQGIASDTLVYSNRSYGRFEPFKP
jgi:flavin reductase (DIM6/NTAB) family NADH-FMN oxidoreductase RutF